MSRFISSIAFIGALASTLPYVERVVSLDSPVTCPDIETTETVLDFENAIVTSTLGIEDDGELRFQNIGTYCEGNDDIFIDLVVKEVPGSVEYTSGNLNNNGQNGFFGQINVKTNSTATFDFCFESKYSQEKITLDAFFFSFYDLDGSTNGEILERISLENDAFTEFCLTDDTELSQSESDGFIEFTASTGGSGDDNPQDPNNLSALEQNRGVVLQMKETDCFRAKMIVACSSGSCSGGRNFLFAGKANQIVGTDTCEPIAAFTVSPNAPTTASPTVTPIPTLAPISPVTPIPTLAPISPVTPIPTLVPTSPVTPMPTLAPTSLATPIPTLAPTPLVTPIPTFAPITDTSPSSSTSTSGVILFQTFANALDLCITIPNSFSNSINPTVRVFDCNEKDNQLFVMDESGYIHSKMNYNKCLGVNPTNLDKTALKLYDCQNGLLGESQKWEFTNGGQIKNTSRQTNTCIFWRGKGFTVHVLPCEDVNIQFVWVYGLKTKTP